MARSLRTLEKTVDRRLCSKHGGRLPIATGQPLPNTYSDLIAVVRGKRVAHPTPGLLALEEQLLGHADSGGQVTREVQRIDHEQIVPVAAATSLDSRSNAPLPTPWSKDFSVSSENAGTSVSSVPQPFDAGTAPEFLAPDTGRFSVEPFTAPERIQPVVESLPATPETDTKDVVNIRTTVPQPASPEEEEEDLDWLKRTRSESAGQVTEASKKALVPGAVVAKDDFERELESILGKKSAVQTEAPEAVPPAPANAQDEVPYTEASAAGYPSHDVFDQMGLAMEYANSFDLGDVSLQKRFDEFDRELEAETGEQKEVSRPLAADNPFVDPMALNEMDLIAELAEIGANDTSRQPEKSAIGLKKTDVKDTDKPQEVQPENTPDAIADSSSPQPSAEQDIPLEAVGTETPHSNDDTAGENHDQPTS